MKARTFEESYLEEWQRPGRLTQDTLWAEMDRVWRECNLDNTKDLSGQAVGKFYSHPVWILNGIFAASDPTSVTHRRAIAAYLARELREARIADYGGGSGVLAQTILASGMQARVDIVEPYPNEFFVSRLAGEPQLRFVRDFQAAPYDVVIAQDVLEHVSDPIEVALNCVRATRTGGLVVFGNCFYPVIECHLPASFYLRHLFRWVLASEALAYVGVIESAEHVQVFRKLGEVDERKVEQRSRAATVAGPWLNHVIGAKRAAGRLARRLGLRR